MTHKKKKPPNNHNNSNKNKNKQNTKNSKRSPSPVDDLSNCETDLDKSVSSCVAVAGVVCEHYDKAINISSFRKQINHIQTVECCRKSSKSSSNQNSSSSVCSHVPKAGNELFVCTQCGTVVCLEEPDVSKSQTAAASDGNSASVSHAHEHHITPRSDVHALYLQLKGEILYCIPCGRRLPVNGTKIMTLLSLIKKARNCWPSDVKESFDNGTTPYTKAEATPGSGSSHNQKKAVTPKSPAPSQKSSDLSLKKEVRGFTNLGNTCFFNSVAQNIMQTVWLRQILSRMSRLQSISLEPNLRLKFDQFGDMSNALVQLYETYFNGSNGTVAPKTLFHSLCQFCPMFKSREQQDSQEMFSCLVNALFDEDEKRFIRIGFLNNLIFVSK